MDNTNTISNDLLPHGAVIQISWEVHRRLPDGKYLGSAADKGGFVFDIQAGDRALANEKVKTLIELIQGILKDGGKLEINEERLGQARIQGFSDSRQKTPTVFGMRGRIGRNNLG